MTAQIYAPRMRQIPSPCARDCPDRQAGCEERCCSWTLYVSVRDHIYDENHRERWNMELDKAARQQVRRAGNKDRRGKSYASK